MNYLTASERKLVVRYLRSLIKSPYVTESWMRRDLLDFISENRLLITSDWPSHFHKLSERGIEFIHENTDAEAASC